MATKKTAGIERPYNYAEFVKLVLALAKEQGHDFETEAGLEYFSASGDYDTIKQERVYRTLDDVEWDLVSETHYGGNEGIYTDFYVRRYDHTSHQYVRYDLATAKTCSRSDEQYMAMHAMAARFETLAMAYIDKHQDEFNWTEFDVTGYKDGKTCGGWWCSENKIDGHVSELLDFGADYVTVRNNRTRETKTYNKFVWADNNKHYTL